MTYQSAKVLKRERRESRQYKPVDASVNPEIWMPHELVDNRQQDANAIAAPAASQSSRSDCDGIVVVFVQSDQSIDKKLTGEMRGRGGKCISVSNLTSAERTPTEDRLWSYVADNFSQNCIVAVYKIDNRSKSQLVGS